MARLQRTIVSIVATAVAAATLAGLPTAQASQPVTGAAGTEQPMTEGDQDRFLRRPANGDAAVARLGADLAEVAALNDMTARSLKGLLLEDESVWVHPIGLLYYVDPAPRDLDPEVAEAAPFPYDQTFQLHSKPGSSRTIYLDFDGETVSGTAWNLQNNYLLPAQTHPAFDLDGNPGSFSSAEQDAIQSIWQRVSEDYAPFDVDVTTADPGLEALRRTNAADNVFGTRALITPSVNAAEHLCGSQCGGVAFMGTYDVPGSALGVAGSDYTHPAWVFPHLLGNGAKAIAEAVSHEVGHNLGLDHDGTADVGYFGGHGAWAPIMGNSYGRPISQWSLGEYAGATLPQQTPQGSPDDLQVITANGLAFQTDDHVNSPAGATPLASTGGTTPGLITTRTDTDYFALPQGCDGSVTVSVAPAPTSPNLDTRLRVLTGDGTVVTTVNPVSEFFSGDVATGMGASATVQASSGTPLYVEVDGVGAGNPATDGYSDYASIGRYTLTSTGCGGPQPGVVAFVQPTQSAGEDAGQALLTVVRTGDTSGAGSVSYARTGGSATPGSDFTLSSGTLTFAADQTQKTIPVSVLDDSLDEGDETVQVTLSSPGTGTVLGATTVSTLTITDDDEPPAAQPDLLISTRAARGYVGDGVYNNSGAKQTKQLPATRKQTRSFFVEVTNDGSTTKRITVLGSSGQKGKKGWVVTYLNNGKDLTSAVTGGQAWIDLAPDDFALLRVDVTLGKRAKIGSLKTVLVTATSADGLTDTVKAVVEVVRK